MPLLWAAGTGIVLMAMTTLRPPAVVTVFPPEGATVTQVTAIGADLEFTRGEPVDPASLRLLVDGVDVTPRATVTMTRDWPPSAATITYAPGGLAPGPHHAALQLQKRAGGTVSHTWSFTVRAP